MKIRFFNENEIALTQYPVLPARKLIPQWFKNLPTKIEQHHDHPTIKTCPGIVKYLTSGFIIRSWADVIIETTSKSVNFSYPNYKPSKRYITVMESMLFNRHLKDYNNPCVSPLALKWELDWYCQAPHGYDLLYLPTQYHPSLDFTIVMGILDTRISEQLNIQVAWHPTKKSVFIPAGTPLVNILPIKRDEFDCEIEKITEMDTTRNKIKFKRITMKKEHSYFDETFFDDSVDEAFSNE